MRNRREQGLAIRSDDLAAEVSLANARLSEIQARTALESAWATYNRYLCRPLTDMASLEELTELPPTTDWRTMAEQAIKDAEVSVAGNEADVQELTAQALRGGPSWPGWPNRPAAWGPRRTSPRAASSRRSASRWPTSTWATTT